MGQMGFSGAGRAGQRQVAPRPVAPAGELADRVGVRSLEDGRRVRYFKSNGEVIDA